MALVQLILKRDDVSVYLNIKDSLWTLAHPLKELFQDDRSVSTITSDLSLLSHWISFLNSKSATELIIAALDSVHQQIYPQNIHLAVISLDDRDFILSTYYKFFHHSPQYTTSALLEAKETNVYALFGGQGPNEEYLIELQALYNCYSPIIEKLVSCASTILDLPLLSWLKTNQHPSIEYSASIPISLPLIGVTQLCHYYVACMVLNLSPGEMRSRFQGATGHSQGVVSAVVISASDSFESFILNFEKGIKLLASIGFHAQNAVPKTHLDPRMVADCVENEGSPSAMLSINGADLEFVQKYIRLTNSFLSRDTVEITLFNGPKHFVVAGPARSLYGLVLSLRKVKASPTDEQSKIAFSARKPVFTMRFLPINVPFHSHYLTRCVDLVMQDFRGSELWTKEEMGIAVYNTESGDDMRQTAEDITRSVCLQIFVRPVNWSKATAFDPSPTHFVDFGPGGVSGIGPLTARNLDGTGVVSIIMNKNAELYDCKSFKVQERWSNIWSPRLVKDRSGNVILDTALSRLTGKPPIWCCGMTPSTVDGGFIVAVTNAGYSIELAGGGHYNANMLRQKVEFIKDRIAAGNGIILNSLYINPRQWRFQYPLWCQLRKEGLPIEGLTIAAGIPSPSVGKDIIENLIEAGIKYVSFKPGSIDGIRQVVSIAAASPTYPILLQWTGGRAGGHHSYEDFHAPILATYSSIRQQKNIVLLVGSGFGTAVETYPYLTGEWALKYGMPSMPTDGLLFGSRLMVAKECKTSLAVKQAIVDAPGVNDLEWEGTYSKATGGILTVRSELGEPIHKIATRGVKLWKELDEKVFSLSKEKRELWLEENKSYVVDRLNADFQKTWFAKKKDGSIPLSVCMLTYEEVAIRMVELMFVKSQKRWIHTSQRNLVGEFLVRIEERFASLGELSCLISSTTSFEILEIDPVRFLSTFFPNFPQSTTQLLSSEDVEFFYSLCQRPGTKPVPFIPLLDSSFEVWFKKDSLWQAEDLDAVVGQDVGRVCILQGPVAVRHSTKVNEPVRDILWGIEKGLVSRLLIENYEDDVNNLEHVEMLGSNNSFDFGFDFKAFPSKYGIVIEQRVTNGLTSTQFVIEKEIPSLKNWLNLLGGDEDCWLRTFLLAPFVVQEKSFVDNPIQRLLKPVIGSDIMVTRVESLSGKLRNDSTNLQTVDGQLTLKFRDNLITMTLRENSEELEFLYIYHPETPSAPIHEVMTSRNHRIKQFYSKIWFNEEFHIENAPSVYGTFCSSGLIEKESVQKFCASVNNFCPSFVTSSSATFTAPMDFGIVIGWKSIIKALFSKEIDGDLLQLVHLSNSFKLLDGQAPLKIGDFIETESRVDSIQISSAGKTVKVVGFLCCGGTKVMRVSSEFFFRGVYSDYHNCFEILTENFVMDVTSKVALSLLEVKAWFSWSDPSLHSAEIKTDHSKSSEEQILIFRLNTRTEFEDKDNISKLQSSGQVYIFNKAQGEIKVGSVEFLSTSVSRNPITAFLSRHAKPFSSISPLENEYEILFQESINPTFQSPLSNKVYADISGDLNPIHLNPYFASYGALPSTITHGMWTSAATRKYLDVVVAENQPQLVKSYEVQFLAMVSPSDQLTVHLTHTAMNNGLKIIKVETFNQNGDKVMSGTAEVEQPRTAFVFTGQGSQEQGMGMGLYNTSEVARMVWDRADSYLQETYSFSIIDIVQNNPLKKTIFFGGSVGQKVRDRYIHMTYDSVDADGSLNSISLFPDINLSSMKYTFSSPTGLLFSTQFAQIALVVTEKAAFEDMKAKGLVLGSSITAFAGHSLGEYAALASVTDFLMLNALCDIVFYRGLTMQRAVERDSENRSNYAMCAVNPSRVGPNFTEDILKEIVNGIALNVSGLCEIVNLNVANQQYVVAGELIALETLSNVLNYIKAKRMDLTAINGAIAKDKFKLIIAECVRNSMSKKKETGFIELQRGIATIPLPGIDIPFHSSHIWSGVGPFRAFISQKIESKNLNVDLLIGKYIPNLNALPFSLEKSYVQGIFDQTASPRLGQLLDTWESKASSTPLQKQQLGYTILVELLAYQFASPVRWIETQDQLFSNLNVTRIIEIGPSPVLCGMASKTLKMKYEVQDTATSIDRQILCISKDTKEIYYQHENVAIVEPEESFISNSTPAIAPKVEIASHQGLAEAIPDEPILAIDILVAIIAQKLKKCPTDLHLSKSIKDLVGGKSTLQNEILGDLQSEFLTTPEKGEELSLEELGATLSSHHSGSLGKHMNSMISRLVNQKFPGGFPLSSARSHIAKTWGLGPGRNDGVLVRALTNEPPTRLGSEDEAKMWLDATTQCYAKEHSLTLKTGSSISVSGSGAGPVMNSEEFDKYKKSQVDFVRQHVELYNRYLGQGSRDGQNLFMEEKLRSVSLQSQIDDIYSEHGERYIKGISPMFNPLKVRRFDSAWNWVRQDAIEMWFDMIFGRLTTVDREITAKCIAIINRSDPEIISIIRFHVESCILEKGKSYILAREFAQLLLENCDQAMHYSPKFKDVTYQTAPCTTISPSGEIRYTEVNRPDVRKFESYVKEMAAGSRITFKVDLEKVQADVLNLYEMVKQLPQTYSDAVKSLYDEVVLGLSTLNGDQSLLHLSPTYVSPTVEQPVLVPDDSLPYLNLKRNLNDILTELATDGSSFENTNALLTGCGRGSIGVEVLKGLLSGGCRVIVTTSSYSRSTVEFFQDIYQVYGSRGSKLFVVPFNQASKQDCEKLIDHIYSSSGLEMDLDYVVPFAAISENGREIDGIDDLSELAHRLMLTNVIRLIGSVKKRKQMIGVNTRPTQGLFGGDGLYSESKVGLEPLFNRWKSESWGQYISIVGCVIGWTRGTGLMNSTNILAQGIEKHGVRTFSAKEMVLFFLCQGFNLLGLMNPVMASISSVEPLWADLSGGMLLLPHLNEIMNELRTSITKDAELKAAISKESDLDAEITHTNSEKPIKQMIIEQRANFTFEFPELLKYETLQEKIRIANPPSAISSGKFDLSGMVDLEKVVVIVGFAEVGPWGSARTRWEMESKGKFSVTGCLELARIMGFVKFFNGRLKNGNLYIGWVETKSNLPISDGEIKIKYEKEILAHAGIRLIEPELFDGYDPKKKNYAQDMILEHDLEPIEVSYEEAIQFKLKHDGNVEIWAEESRWLVKFKKGALLMAIPFDRTVAGQIPTGWDAKRYGLTDDIINQVDPCTLWSLVATAEALASAGITDPYEMFKYVHVSEVGCAIGSGMGGQRSLQGIFHGRYLGKDIQKDVLQESFINTTAGWINLLLLSASGPVKIPVGACATALQSLEIGIDTIASGKARVMICGGVDDFSEEGSAEFANMKATSNSLSESEQGRSPSEMSRPTTSSRSGFMEAQGSGVQVLMQASLAIEMGVPIYGILAHTALAMDKQGRSIPAPGQGILSTAKEVVGPLSPRLDLAYRQKKLAFRRKQIGQWLEHEHQELEAASLLIKDKSKIKDFLSTGMESLMKETKRQESECLDTWGTGFYKNDPQISPLRGSLASWGLSIDDISVVSFHGTSTVANDKNESDVTNKQFSHLGRSKGNSCAVIAQKWLTGHPKGAAAAWMTNGLIQTILTGLIPGNRNADNIAPELEKFSHLFFPSRSIQTDGIKAGVLKSFGFGQVGGEALLIHPEYLLSSLSNEVYQEYQAKNKCRWQSSYRMLHDAMVHENLVKLKDAPPYSPELESEVLLNPLQRVKKDHKGKFAFQANESVAVVAKSMLGSDSANGVGIDTELLSSFPLDNPTFISRNFTSKEISDPRSSFTGRWTAKEAVVKSISSFAASIGSNIKTTQGSGAPLIDIEVLSDSHGVPIVHLHGFAEKLCKDLKIKDVKVSISHADTYAVSICLTS